MTEPLKFKRYIPEVHPDIPSPKKQMINPAKITAALIDPWENTTFASVNFPIYHSKKIYWPWGRVTAAYI